MKNFSMFELASQLAQDARTEDLGRALNLSRRDFDERETFHFRAQAPCLEYGCLLIENALLLKPNRTGRVYAGFEKLSRLEGVVDRYLRIADLSERVYVFGVPDWQPPRHPNMRLMTLAKNAKLAREWFVIADSSTLRVALVAAAETATRQPALEERSYRAFKTSNPQIVAQLAAAAEGLIDSSLAA